MRSNRWSRIAYRSASVALCLLAAVTLTFPGLMRWSDTELLARAAWLQAQHENLTWLGGDIATAYEHSNAGFKSRVYAVDVPRRVLVTVPATWRFAETRPDHFSLLFQELGYSNVFCQFAKRGWFLGLGGSLCLIFVSVFEAGELNQGRLRRVLIGGVVLAVGYVVVVLTPSFVAGAQIRDAEQLTAAGNYEGAIESLDEAASALPLLPYNSEFQRQRALLSWRQNRRDASQRLFEALLLEDEGRFHQADEIYQRLVTSDAPVPIKREAARALMRSAIHAFNSDRLEQARRELNAVRAFEPAHLKANYLLQTTSLQEGQRGRIEDLVEDMQDTYRFFSFPNRKVVLAACQQHLAYAAMQQHDLPATWRHLNRYRRP